MVVPQKIKIELPYDPAIPHLATYPKELKAVTQKNICTRCHDHSNVVHNGQKVELAQLSIDRLIIFLKKWYVYIMEYYSALKRKEILTHG